MKKKLLRLITFILRRKKVKKKRIKRKVKPYFILLPIYSSLIKSDLETKGVVL